MCVFTLSTLVNNMYTWPSESFCPLVTILSCDFVRSTAAVAAPCAAALAAGAACLSCSTVDAKSALLLARISNCASDKSLASLRYSAAIFRSAFVSVKLFMYSTYLIAASFASLLKLSIASAFVSSFASLASCSI